MYRLSSSIASNAFKAIARRPITVCRARKVVAACGTASVGLCMLGGRGPATQESWLEKARHEVEEIVHEVENEVAEIKHVVEEDIELVRHKTEELIHEAEEELVEYVVHPLRDTFVRVAPYIIPLKKYIHYLAYSSDVGEAFRPIASVMSVNATYALAIGYCCGDVLHNGYVENQKNPGEMGKVALTMVHSAVFQVLASLLAPYLIIHTAVGKSNSLYFKTSKCSSGFLRTWGASIVALSIIPFLPMVDEPIEEGVDWMFDHVVPHKQNNREFEAQQQRSDTPKVVSVSIPASILSTKQNTCN